MFDHQHMMALERIAHWARRLPRRTRAIAGRHKSAIEIWLADEFARSKVAEPAERTRQTTIRLEGCQSMMLIQGDRRYAESAARADKQLIT